MNNNDETYLNHVELEEKFEIQPILQAKENINVNEGGKWRKIWKKSTFQEESGEMIVEMRFTSHFIV